MFGPDAETLRAIADRIASRVVTETVEAVAAHRYKIVGYGCVLAGGSGVLVVLAIIVGRALLMVAERWLDRKQSR